MVSLSNSSRFPANACEIEVNPVMFSPGRARLSTSPAATGSTPLTKTMGIVLVAFLAAKISAVEDVKSTSTLSRTSSSVSAGIRGELTFRVSILESYRFALNVAELTEHTPN
jgi:hypothetical protein